MWTLERQRRVLRGARSPRLNGSRTCRATGTGWSRDCIRDRAGSSPRSTTRSRKRERSPVARGYWTGPRIVERCSSGAARCSSTRRPSHRCSPGPRRHRAYHDRAELTSSPSTTRSPGWRTAADRLPHRRLRGRPAGRRPPDDRHRQLQGHQHLRGHVVGDLIIRRVAAAVGAHIGPDALLGRLGGDEFAVIVAGRPATAAMALAERLCEAVAVATAVDPTLHVSQHRRRAAGRGPGLRHRAGPRRPRALRGEGGGRNRARLSATRTTRPPRAACRCCQRVGAALDERCCCSPGR